jgi:hypothetical protein
MSGPTTADDTGIEKVEKTVQLIAYGGTDYADAREYGQALADAAGIDIDLSEMSSSTTINHYIVVGETKKSVTRSEYRDFAVAKAEGDLDFGDIKLKKEENTSRSRRWKPQAAVDRVFDAIGQTLPDELPDGFSRQNDRKWCVDNQRFVRLSTAWRDDIKRRRLLTKESNREDGLYAQPEDTPLQDQPWSFTVTLQIEATSSEMATAISEEIVPTVTDALLNYRPVVQRTRLTDCTEKVTKEGDCIQAF